MTERIAIRGIGIAGGFGCGKDAAIKALHGEKGPNSQVAVQLADGSFTCPVYSADVTPLKRYIKSAALRRVNRYSRLACLAACLALEDANIPIPCKNSRTAVIIGSGYGATTTTFGFLESVIREGDNLASPTLFSNSVHSSAASNVSILLGITGPSLTITQFEMSIAAAFLNARSLLLSGIVDTVLLESVDEINDVLTYFYANDFGNKCQAKIVPLDFMSQTAIPGEGAACLVLTRDEGDSVCGYVENVQWQRSEDVVLAENKNSFVVGADGHHSTGVYYKKIFRNSAERTTSYSNIYGSFPSSQMFDIIFGLCDAKIVKRFNSIKVDCRGNVGFLEFGKA